MDDDDRDEDNDSDEAKAVSAEFNRWRNPSAAAIDPSRTPLGRRRALRQIDAARAVRLEGKPLPAPTTDVERQVARYAANARAVLDRNLPPDRRPPPVQLAEESPRPAVATRPAPPARRVAVSETSRRVVKEASQVKPPAGAPAALEPPVRKGEAAPTSFYKALGLSQPPTDAQLRLLASPGGVDARPIVGAISCPKCNVSPGKPCRDKGGALIGKGACLGRRRALAAMLTPPPPPDPHEAYYASYSLQ
jgi:hypothetical protein